MGRNRKHIACYDSGHGIKPSKRKDVSTNQISPSLKIEGDNGRCYVYKVLYLECHHLYFSFLQDVEDMILVEKEMNFA